MYHTVGMLSLLLFMHGTASNDIHLITTNYSWSREHRLRRAFPVYLQAGLLTHRSAHETAFPISQWLFGFIFPIHSDEFVQDFHLFPFSPKAFHRFRHL